MSDETSKTESPKNIGPENEGFQEAQIRVPFPDTYIYSNVSALSLSMMDIRIGFSEALQDGTAHARVGIVMPPEHAAALALNMLRQLVLFERSFGEIRHPEWKKFLAASGTQASLELKGKVD